jgi:hypothetical protein
MAIRTGKIYIEQMPVLPRHLVELYVDIEGNPDRDSYYLIGLLVCEGDEVRHHFWWADGVEEEQIWLVFVETASAFPDAPIYHYGSYERKAFQMLAKRYGRGAEISKRLVNVAASVYGKVYFPVRSNGLKVLGRFVGATWTYPEASGLMSLVWRHRWEMTKAEQHRLALIQYNHEDCEAVRLLVEKLRQIGRNAESEPTIDFAHRPKQNATDLGRGVHRQFERILRYAQQNGHERSLRIRPEDLTTESKRKKKGAPKGHQAYQRIVPERAGRIVAVTSKRKCPRHHKALVPDSEQLAEREGCGSVPPFASDQVFAAGWPK